MHVVKRTYLAFPLLTDRELRQTKLYCSRLYMYVYVNALHYGLLTKKGHCVVIEGQRREEKKAAAKSKLVKS